MNDRIIRACAVAAALGLVAPAAAANAQPAAATADTTVNLTVNENSAGSLRFSVAPQASTSLIVNFGGDQANSAMVAPSIRDDRAGSPRSYTLKADITDFVTGGGAPIGNENVRMWLTAVTGVNGTTTSVGSWGEASNMSEQVTLLSRTGITLPDVSTTYTPNIRVTLPTVTEGDTTVVDVQAGEYSATLTQSLY
ncbi:hypothetical protein [Rhodococcus sp. IEGM 1408]|uniref:hypothetical protein n=1 Tax=Rhodococcus sp. IEGM 1408 TaxID=3082220 RepID=UPI0029547478|nr:hypothetical protein [Rhodococcus sp. IEGM 1408]MDV8003006.1 hypothetical protein [Rhodococcus sp. IEGM 1408]